MNGNTNSRSMNGLQSIVANTINTGSIITGSLQYTVSATGITQPLSDNTNALATTAFVQANSGSNILSLNNTWTGNNTFNNLPTSTATPAISTQLVTKSYADAISTGLLGGSNTWTGNNSYTYNLPTTVLVPTLGPQLVNKTYADSLTSNLQSSNNAWTGTNSFNSNLPTSTLTPSSGSQLVTKTYADSIRTNLLSSSNAWTNTNTFNSNLPTSTLTPSSGSQLVTKTYADSIGTNLLSSSNAWTNTNTFNSNLPTSTLTPSSGTQLVTKTYADSIGTNLLSSSNAWTGTNTFNSNLPTSTLTPSSGTQLVTKTYADSVGTNLLTSSNTWSNTNQFNGLTNFTNTCSFNGSYTAFGSPVYFANPGTNIALAVQSYSGNQSNLCMLADASANVYSTSTLAGDAIISYGTYCTYLSYGASAGLNICTGNTGVLNGIRIVPNNTNFNGSINNTNNFIAYNCLNNTIQNPGACALQRITTFGYTNVCAFLCPPNSSLDVVVNIPVSVWCNFYTTYGGSDTQTRVINSAIYVVQKNYATIYSGTPISNNTLPKTVVIVSPSGSYSQSYTCYYTNFTVSFSTQNTSTDTDYYQVFLNLTCTDTFSNAGHYSSISYGLEFNTVTSTFSSALSSIYTGTYGSGYSAYNITTTKSATLPLTYSGTGILSTNLLIANAIISKNYFCGVYGNPVGLSSFGGNALYPLFISYTDMTVIYGGGSAIANLGGTFVGTLITPNLSGMDTFVVLPGYGITYYSATGWSGTVYLNCYNTGTHPLCVQSTSGTGKSCKIYYQNNELT